MGVAPGAALLEVEHGKTSFREQHGMHDATKVYVEINARGHVE
jgi:hypothetical protein